MLQLTPHHELDFAALDLLSLGSDGSFTAFDRRGGVLLRLDCTDAARAWETVRRLCVVDASVTSDSGVV